VDAAHVFSGTKTSAAGTNHFTILATDPSGNSATRTYQLDATATSRTFTYDANGNLTADGTRTFEWDAVNRRVAVSIGTHRSEFSYDGLDRRVRIVEENGATVREAQLYWDGAEIIEERLSAGEVNRFFRHGEQHDGVARYLTRDHLGGIRETTDTGGAVVTRNDYDPYGRVTRVVGTQDSRFGFTGHYYHAASGLALALYRAYDPALGRWLRPDFAYMIDGPNLFIYANSNPLGLVDPLGRDWSWPGAGRGAISGGIDGAIGGAIGGSFTGGLAGAVSLGANWRGVGGYRQCDSRWSQPEGSYHRSRGRSPRWGCWRP
jgi:RHS repeat-associated protein